MHVASAIKLITNLVYKPGWYFEPTDNNGRFENSVAVRVTYPAYNSDRDQAEKGYPEYILPLGARASFTILCEGLNDETLYHALTEIIMCIEAHEMREFLRVKPNYWAPFHPHNTDGIKRWAMVTGQDYKSVLQADTTFGLA